MTPKELFLMGMEANGHRYVETGPGRFKGCCPAHDDLTPSMQITEAPDGRLLVHCYAGCDISDIVYNVGLELRQLFPDTGNDYRSLRPSRKSSGPSEDKMVLEICASARRQGRRLTDHEKQLERDAFMRVRSNNAA